MSALASVDDVLAGRRTWACVHADNRDVLPTLADGCVQHVITDPPYESEAHTLQRRVKREGGAMETEPLSFAPLTEAGRSGAAVEFARLAQRWIVAFCQVEAAMRWSSALADAGAVTKRIGVWVKPDAMPQYSGDRPGMGYESIVFAHALGRSRWNGGGRVGVFVHNKNSPDRTGHETQKPLPLMLELVELFTDPGDVVLDCFSGSCTTGVACLRLGRRFIGIEKDADFCRVAVERMQAEQSGLSLRAARAGQLSLLNFAGGTP